MLARKFSSEKPRCPTRSIITVQKPERFSVLEFCAGNLAGASKLLKVDNRMKEARFQKDQRILTKIFPNVVWLLICDRLARFPDVAMTLFHASVFLRHLLKSRRNLFLFFKVLPMEHEVFRTRLEVVVKPFTNRDFFKLRFVCRLWCHAVDTNISPVFKRYTKFPSTKISNISPIYKKARFLSHYEQSHLQTNGRSPFLGNAATFDFLWFRWRDDGEKWNVAVPFKQVLQKYGHHVRYCKISFYCQSISERWLDAAVLHTLSCLPNLNILELNLHPRTPVNQANPGNVLAQLPELKNLEHLRLNIGSTNEVVERKLLPKMPNVKCISISRDEAVTSLQNLLPRAQLSKLECLKILLPGYHANLQDQPVSREHDCPLDAGMHATLRTLEAHSPLMHLRRLVIWLSCTLPNTWQEWKNYKIELPHLEALKLGSTTWPCIDMILLFCKSLRRLDLHVNTFNTWEEWNTLDGAEELREREQIKFLSSNGHLEKTHNIWVEMPKLEDVTVDMTLIRGQDRRHGWFEDWKRNGHSERINTF